MVRPLRSTGGLAVGVAASSCVTEWQLEEVTQMRELFQEALGAGAQAPGVTREPEDKGRLDRIG